MIDLAKRLGIICTAIVLLTGCIRKWTQADRDQFVKGCISSSVKDMTAQKAEAYCNCMLQQVEKRYPNAADVKYISQDTAMNRIGKECLPKP
jgi:hypothetical protein